jgi:hypothetical protein
MCWGTCVLPSAALRMIFAAPTELRGGEVTNANAAAQITEDNWQKDPRIKEIRQLVSSTNVGLKARVFKISERHLEQCDGDQLFVAKRMASDSQRGVKWYEHYSEGQDASWDFQNYYDGTGRLRFVYAIARSANGTREQLRIYFDETRKRIWTDDKLLKGTGCPGCFSGYAGSDKGLAFDPGKEYADNEGCEEIKHGRQSK